MQTYKLHTALTGVLRAEDGRMSTVTLPVGAEIQFATIKLQSGMLDGAWDGRTVSVFVEDLMKRGAMKVNS